MNAVKVNPKILAWARETAGLTIEDAVEKLGIKSARGVAPAERLAALESGETAPTRAMLVKMASAYRRPLLTFYLAEPPKLGDRGEDFRTLPQRDQRADAWLDALIRDVSARQTITRAALEDEDAQPLLFIGSMSTNDGVPALVNAIQQQLSCNVTELREANSADDLFKTLRAKVEAVGVFVLLKSDLGSHHTAIDPATFRGFALADPIAPFIVINDRDAKTAWSFTLLHELCHLWIGATGVSGAFADLEIERFCNDVASQILLPDEEFRLIFDQLDTDEPAADVISRFAGERYVSRTLVAYRIYRAGRISLETWQQLAHQFRDEWITGRQQRRDRDREREGGPSYYVVRRHRLGNALITLVARMLQDGTLSSTKAGKVLGVKPQNLPGIINAPAAGS